MNPSIDVDRLQATENGFHIIALQFSRSFRSPTSYENPGLKSAVSGLKSQLVV